ncbi:MULTISPECIES: ABC transporter permease [Brenneria]|uniref:ABC transporter permease n=1 Tax=Brenneria nigrifluens DSM 30175 = ATCC 13028 TaxID=1121120 RepID=A0A2U1UR96_9GAMM|nr:MULTISPECIES: ABC transporter permease [Brenneria]EHD22370.1 ABC-type transporter, integral membrane subunit [Brenneria sp. EniD312]PWC24190.1 ABC transporter permease [Brenneria nigrifluens] [Brenneria nigrifluens DSM 30175 = ATCC 13028]QCR05381.1 ABC transporter permease [Brenneria nigrifluens] [Brenneria nigrifluens DSM 30175 = ATCC 13028]
MNLSLPARRNWKPWLLLAPSLLALLVFFIYPLLNMLSVSLYGPDFTWRHYLRIIHEPVWINVLWITLRISLWVTLSTLLLGYPLAWVLATLKPRTANIFLIVVIIPYFTSVLVRTYAWMVLLGAEGIVNQLLTAVGLITEPLKLMYTSTGVLIGMTYILLPYMILALYSVMRGIDLGLLSAAESLGASRRRAFWRIIVPLSLPGVAAGGLLVFILSLGFFITPALMGGPQQTMVSMVIESQIETYFDWGFGSALSSVLLIVTLALFWLYQRLIGLEQLFEAKR